ncbi:MAG TPA: VWA domain-containing protein [Candidatus Solibacter sp.]|jgi:VWFA-related protein
MSTRREFLAAAAALLPLRAQDVPTFTTDIKLVTVLATVTNHQGEIVRNLTKDDFLLLEDKRPQNIRYFSQESDLPLTLGLMVDTSMSQRRVLDAERGASYRFIETVLRPNKDQVFLMQFDFRIFMRQPLTNSLRQLSDSLPYVDTPTFNQLRAQSGGGTLLYDAVVTASQDVMLNRTGRKALILLTDGEDFGSDASVSDAIEAAQRADTLIYSILFADQGDGRRPLQRMSKETGGGFFEVSKKQNIDQIFTAIQEELRSQYSLAYVSDKPVITNEFRHIQLTARQKGLAVQSRDRYFARH